VNAALRKQKLEEDPISNRPLETPASNSFIGPSPFPVDDYQKQIDEAIAASLN
jgi:hypothetical protein